MRFPRRHFLRAATAALALPSFARAIPPQNAKAYSFVLLGDLHFDRLAHHDMAWLERHKAGDLSQIRNYSRITADIMPALLAAVRESVAESRAAFVLQVGDLVEGLCGTEALAVRQNSEAIAFLESARLGAPFLFTKGNHDVTGDGAVEAFAQVFHPFLSAQAAGFRGGGEKPTSANFAIEHGGAQFCFFDAYDRESLDWLETALARRTARHCFVVVHPPVVPYGARATWHLYSSERDRARREKLLGLLGRHEVFVLGGHIHKWNTICRTTAGGGRFAQLALSSVVNQPDARPATALHGLAEYNGDQIRVEPRHSPETAEARRAVYAAEAPFVRAFEYADLPGHAVVTVEGASVRVTMHAGTGRTAWKTVDLSRVLTA